MHCLLLYTHWAVHRSVVQSSFHTSLIQLRIVRINTFKSVLVRGLKHEFLCDWQVTDHSSRVSCDSYPLMFFHSLCTSFCCNGVGFCYASHAAASWCHVNLDNAGGAIKIRNPDRKTAKVQQCLGSVLHTGTSESVPGVNCFLLLWIWLDQSLANNIRIFCARVRVLLVTFNSLLHARPPVCFHSRFSCSCAVGVAAERVDLWIQTAWDLFFVSVASAVFLSSAFRCFARTRSGNLDWILSLNLSQTVVLIATKTGVTNATLLNICLEILLSMKLWFCGKF